MEKIDRKIGLYFQMIIFALIWFALVKFFGDSTLNLADFRTAFSKLPQAIGIYSVLFFVFTKWAWRWRIFRNWLVKVPNIEGTWTGHLLSSWINPETKATLPPIPASLVIKQGFYKISCRLFTKESQSFSVSADVTIGPDDALCLSYTYTNKPGVLIRDRSAIHDGAAILQIIQQPTLSLEGDYWTSRKTSGTMKFEFKSNKIEEKFSQ